MIYFNNDVRAFVELSWDLCSSPLLLPIAITFIKIKFGTFYIQLLKILYVKCIFFFKHDEIFLNTVLLNFCLFCSSI